MHQDPGERSSDPTKRLSHTCLGVSRSLQQRHGSAVACFRAGGSECSSLIHGIFWRRLPLSSLPPPYFGPWSHRQRSLVGYSLWGRKSRTQLRLHFTSLQIAGREHSATCQQKIVLKIYWAWPHPSEQDPTSPSVSLSHQEASISLLSFSIRQSENHNHRKLTSLITWTTAMSDSMTLWAMLWRAIQHGWVMEERADKTWSTGEGNGKPLQYSCLENPMNSMKRQKDRTLKDELLRQVGAQYATGDQWRNNSRKNEGMESKQKNSQLWMWLVMEARSNAV